MQRCCLAITFLAALLLAAAAHAQMGMDIFKRPTITKVFHPVVGKGAAYLSTDKDGKTRNSEISIVGKDSVDGKEGFWMEFVSNDNNGKPMVGKALITLGDFQFHRGTRTGGPVAERANRGGETRLRNRRAGSFGGGAGKVPANHAI